MPTYSYICKECKHEWEEFQAITDPAVKTCPKCNKEFAQRQLGTPIFMLVGNGWASDGYSKP